MHFGTIAVKARPCMKFSPKLSKAAFFEYYSKNNPIGEILVSALEEYMVALPCACSDSDCKGWTMLERSPKYIAHHYLKNYPQGMNSPARKALFARLESGLKRHTTESQHADDPANLFVDDLYGELMDAALSEMMDIEEVYIHRYEKLGVSSKPSLDGFDVTKERLIMLSEYSVFGNNDIHEQARRMR